MRVIIIKKGISPMTPLLSSLPEALMSVNQDHTYCIQFTKTENTPEGIQGMFPDLKNTD